MNCANVTEIVKKNSGNSTKRSRAMAAADQNGKSSKELSLDVVQELLKVQENSFKTQVSSLLTNFNDRFDKLTREVHDLKHSLEYSQKDIEEVKSKLQSSEQLQEEILSIKSDMAEMEDKLDYQENQTHRNNLRISERPGRRPNERSRISCRAS